MNIAYCSLLLPEEKRLAERSKERLSGISGHKVTSATIKGLDANLDFPMTIFNIINTLNYPKFPQIIFKDEKWNHIKDSEDWHIGYINFIGIKYITQAYNLYLKLSRWVNSKCGERCIICVHYIYYPAMVAACLVKYFHKDQVILCLNTGDIPGRYGLKSKSKAILKDFLITHIVDNGIMSMAKYFDCFVFVTKEMAKAFGVESKPFVVLECTYTQPQWVNISQKYQKNEDEIKNIFYAGALREEYGITHLLRAFSLIHDPNYRLTIAGGGPSEEQILEYSKHDSRIQFLGFITPQDVFIQQQKATVLVNPRTSELEYVKYSFPSKSVDSLASGTPYIAHRLPCDPPEYEDFIQYTKNDSDEALAEKMIEICELSEERRKNIGMKARAFIINEKNPNIMTKRVVDMWAKQLHRQI